MAAKLTKSLGQANALISTINSNAQISNHLVNEEWGYAGSELATTLVGLAMTAGGSIAIVAGAPVALTTGVVMVSAMVVLPEIEAWGDKNLERFNHKDFLNVINLKFGLPSIFKLADDAIDDLICSMISPHKRKNAGCSIRPIIFDLDGDGLSYTNLDNSPYLFDVNNDGILDKLSWPTKGNAVLIADWNGSGIIDKRTEIMFSLFSPKKSATDLEGLMTFDYDSNNVINNLDPIFEKLFIWNDKNEDGLQTYDEINSLNSLGINFYFTEKEVKSAKNFKLDSEIDQIFKFKSLTHVGNAYSIRMKVRLN